MSDISEDLLQRLYALSNQKQSSVNDLLEAMLDQHTTADFERIITENTREGIWMVDLDGKTTYVNRQMAEMLGYKVEAMLDQPLFDFTYESDRESITRRLAARRAGQSERHDFRFRHAQGHPVWTIVSTNPVYDGDGTSCGAVAIITDITDRKRAEQALIESEARFRKMAESTPVLLWVGEADGSISYFNERWLNFTGRSLEQEIDFGWRDRTHPDDLEQVMMNCEAALENQTDYQLEYRLRHHDGTYRWLLEQATPRFTEQGAFAGFIGSCVDITEQKLAADILLRAKSELEAQVTARTRELQRERDLLEKAIITSPAAILLLNDAGKIIYASERAQTLFRREGVALLSQPHHALLTDARTLDEIPLTSEQLPFAQMMQTEQPVNDFEFIFDAKGDAIVASWSSAPIFNETGDIKESIVTIEDITMRKESEMRLREALQHEQTLNQMKNEFVSLVTHELKNPLAVIQSSSDLLRKYLGRMTEEQRLDHLDKIQAQVAWLTEMINEMLDINRAERARGRLHRTSVNLNTFFDKIVSNVRLAYRSDITINMIRVGMCSEWYADEVLLEQIVTNLLSNAVKYSRARGTVTVRYRCDQDTLYIEIADQGIGIPEADQAHLFESFHRAKNVGNIDGTGLGLIIVKQAIEAHGGTITLESEEGKGTTVRLTLPRTT